MGIMLAGVMYPDIDLTVTIPNRPLEDMEDIDRVFIPNIPGMEIKENIIEIQPELPEAFDYSVIRLKKPKTNAIDTNTNIPEPVRRRNEYISLDIPIPKVSTSSNSLLGSTNLVNMGLSYIPVFSEEYKSSLGAFQESSRAEGFKQYNDELIDTFRSMETRIARWVNKIGNKGSSLGNDLKNFGSNSINNDNLYGEIPLGYAYTIDRGKVRWEEIDWAINSPERQGYDIWLSRGGIIKLGNKTIRPDLNLKTSNTKDVVNIRDAQNADNADKYYKSNFDQTNELRTINRSVYYMMSSGADFIQNMFDVAIVFRDENGIFDEIIDHEKYGGIEYTPGLNIKQIIGEKGKSIMIRTSSIEVPQIENETFQVKFFGSTINKVKSKIKYERKSSLKILLDEPLYMRMLFNLLSGNSRISPENLSSKPKNLYAGNLQGTINGSIDILLKHEALLNYPYLGEMKQVWRTKYKEDPSKVGYAENRAAEYPIWWFQDVKFLGEGSDLTFDRDGNSVTELNFPFIFSRCVRVDRSAKIAGKGKFINVNEEGISSEPPQMGEFTELQNNQSWMWKQPFWQGRALQGVEDIIL
jgi:hypothetical protein